MALTFSQLNKIRLPKNLLDGYPSSNSYSLLSILDSYNSLRDVETINTLLPTQVGQSGKFLTTNGTSVSWSTSGAGTVTGAAQGLTLNGANIELGNTTSGSGAPLSSSRYISMAGNLLTLEGSGTRRTKFDGGSLVIDTVVSSFGTPISEAFVRINPTNLHPHNNSPWTLGVTDATNNGPTYLYPNRVWWWGVNCAGASIASNPTGILWQDVIESSWVSGDVPFYERHDIFKMPGKDAIRLQSATLQHPNAYYGSTTFNFDYYRTTNAFTLRGIKNEVGSSYTTTDFFSVGFNPTTQTTSFSLALSTGNGLNIQGITSGSDLHTYFDGPTTGGTNRYIQFRNYNSYTFGTGVKIDATNNIFYVNTIVPVSGTDVYIGSPLSIARTGSHSILNFNYNGAADNKGAIDIDYGSGEMRYSVLSGYFKTFYTNGSEILRLQTSTASIPTGKKFVVGGTTADTSAIVDIQSTTQGFLPPRMTTGQRDAISSPAEGLILFNTTTTKLQVRAGAAWVDLH